MEYNFENSAAGSIKLFLENKKGLIIFIVFFFISYFSSSQVIFSEPFNEATGATSGNDNTGGVSWSTSCGTCLAGDYFNVQSGLLQCDDTNGPATWTTNNINVAACTGGLNIAMVISETSATNAFEECTAGCGCNCVDWMSVEYNLNNTGYIPLSSAQGGTCTQTCTGGTYVLLGEINPGSAFTFSSCLPAATTLKLRITAQTWAQGEIYTVDNVTVQCSNCALPIELLDFKAKEYNESIELMWTTATEKNNDYFTIERSIDGINFETVGMVNAVGNSQSINNYKDYDLHPLDQAITYYRLKQTDNDGTFTYSEIITVEKNKNEIDFVISPNPSGSGIFNLTMNNHKYDINTTVEILDYTGRKILEFPLTTISESINLSAYVKGLYIVRINSGSLTASSKIIYN